MMKKDQRAEKVAPLLTDKLIILIVILVILIILIVILSQADAKALLIDGDVCVKNPLAVFALTEKIMIFKQDFLT